MPKGPRGEKPPGDVIGDAIKTAHLATGEEVEELGPVSPGAALGKRGGRRAHNFDPEQRAKQAEKTAAKRWEKSLRATFKAS